VIENDAADLLALKRAFSDAGVANPLYTTRSSAEAMRYLTGEYPYSNRIHYPFPSVILLDVDLPEGFDLLTWIRNRFPGGGLLIVALTRVEEIRKISRAYSMGASSFLTKPATASELQELVNIFSGYWLVQPSSFVQLGGLVSLERFAYDA
jgi:CheY-like chemotaxis protein